MRPTDKSLRKRVPTKMADSVVRSMDRLQVRLKDLLQS